MRSRDPGCCENGLHMLPEIRTSEDMVSVGRER